MSANLDLVRSIYADWERGDFSVVDWAHPDIEYSIVGGLESGRWWGVRAMTERSREQLREFDHFRIEVDGCREVDDERVLVLWRFRGRGKASGLEPPGTGAYLLMRPGARRPRQAGAAHPACRLPVEMTVCP